MTFDIRRQIQLTKSGSYPQNPSMSGMPIYRQLVPPEKIVVSVKLR
jgi:hypothetical protein